MKLASIKKLVETCSVDQLRLAEEAIYNEIVPDIEIEGEDEGEQLTHVLSAIAILEEIQQGKEMKDALRSFSQRVRDSLSK